MRRTSTLALGDCLTRAGILNKITPWKVKYKTQNKNEINNLFFFLKAYGHIFITDQPSPRSTRAASSERNKDDKSVNGTNFFNNYETPGHQNRTKSNLDPSDSMPNKLK